MTEICRLLKLKTGDSVNCNNDAEGAAGYGHCIRFVRNN